MYKQIIIIYYVYKFSKTYFMYVVPLSEYFTWTHGGYYRVIINIIFGILKGRY